MINIVKLDPVFFFFLSSTGEEVLKLMFTLGRGVERPTKYAIDFSLF